MNYKTQGDQSLPRVRVDAIYQPKFGSYVGADLRQVHYTAEEKKIGFSYFNLLLMSNKIQY